MSTRQEETPKTYIKSNTAAVKGLMSFLSIVLLIVVAGLCAYVLIGYKGIRKNQDSNAQQFNFHLENDTATILEFYDYEADKCVIPETIVSENKNYTVTVLAETAFTDHGNLIEVQIPNTVTHIMGNAETGKGAFSGCVNLQTVTLGNKVSYIGAYAFKNCLSLSSISIPASVGFVEEGAFLNCLSLDTIELNSNGALAEDCFMNCLNVTTLRLADEVALYDARNARNNEYKARKAFAGLIKLTNFEISDANPYHQYDATANCLLGTTDTENDTLVLAGCKTTIPASVTTIIDWAWGERAVDNLYVPDTVTTISANAFSNQAICTNAATKPIGWLTVVPVYTNAKVVTFKAKDQTVEACIYNDGAGKPVVPAYEDLFPDLVTATPFMDWTNEYEAIYESENKSNKHLALSSASGAAAPYLNDLTVCALYKIDFWEDFKSVYYRAGDLNVADTYDYIVDGFINSLNDKKSIVDQTAANYIDFLENTSWTARLQKLVDAVDSLDWVDFSRTNEPSVWESLEDLTNGAKELLDSGSGANDAVLKTIWEGLRKAYEELIADVSVNGALGSLIGKCENLNRSNYTKESWNKMQECLQAAREITSHNMSISVVRHDLDAAVKVLQEVGIEENLTQLNTWISVCEDLNPDKYEEGQFDQLMIKLFFVKGKVEPENTLVTRSAINSEINDLKSLHRQLKYIEREEPEASIVMLAINTLPYFIVAAILFTGAVIAGSLSGKLKRKMRDNSKE